jgi:hypothetical protein
MSMEDLASSMTGVGQVAAVVGLMLAVFTLALRVRERNLAEAARRAQEEDKLLRQQAQPDSAPKHAPADLPGPPAPAQLFKPYRPESANKDADSKVG